MPTLEQKVLIKLLAGEIRGETELCEEELKNVDWSEVLKEAKAQTVPLMAAEGAVKYKEYIPNYKEWENSTAIAYTLNVRTAYYEQQLNALMDGHAFVILKGMAAASYYPNPRERSFGDIDFLIDPSQRAVIEDLLSKDGYEKSKNEHGHHVAFKKGDACLEMHFAISGIPHGKQGEIVKEFMRDAIEHPVTAQFDWWSFPAPEDIYHGLIILLHMQHHMLGSGLGLRHICDWACFLQKTEGKPFWNELINLFQKIGILTYAKVISKISAMYFHIDCPEWAEDAEEELCMDVMNDVLTGGNFGCKDKIRAQSCLMISDNRNGGTNHGKLYSLFLNLHRSTTINHPKVKKYPLLYPALYFYRALIYLIRSAKGERKSLIKLVPEANKRKSIYDRMNIFEAENNGKSD